MGQVELRIEGSVESGWTAQWSLDGIVAGSEIRVGAADSARLAAEGRRFLALFEQGVRPLVDPTVLSSLGAELARIWLDPARAALAAALGAGGSELVIAGYDACALDLPWELVEVYPGLPVGCDAAWTLRREAIADGAARSNLPLPVPGGGPLRILFLASSPEDQEPLDLEREEDLVLRPTEGLRGEVIVHIAEVGTFDELQRLVGRVKPQVIHLSGHGSLNSDGEGVFAFETEEGETDLRTAEQIAAAVARGSSVRLFVLNACKSAQSGTSGLCRALAAAGVPHALGWAASVEDRVASRFTAALYGELMTGVPVDRAVAHARLELRDQGVIETGPLLDASFAVSQLYGRGAADLIDLGKPREAYAGPRTEYALLGDGVKGLKEGFIGRRRDVWKVLKAMRRGEPTVAFLWGLGGAGKSTLATRVANRLHHDGFHILPVRAPDGDDPAAVGRETHSKVVGAIERAFQKTGREDLLGTLRSEKIRPEQRLRLVVEGLCEIRALLVLDNLEGALALETRRIIDPGLAFLLRLIATDLTRGSRLLITCRYEIADLEDLGLLGLEVKDFRDSDVRKFFRRDEKVEERLHRGEISLRMFDRLAHELGGTPRFLETARTVLQTVDPEDLLADLDGLEPGPLTEKRWEYLEGILAQRLYEALSPVARSLASRLALSQLPLPVEGVARIAECGEEEAKVALAEGVAYGLIQNFDETDLHSLFNLPGLLRPWVIRLGDEDGRDLHAKLARFWREICEGGREKDLRVPIEVGLTACRWHAKLGAEWETFGWATEKYVAQLHKRAEWCAERALLEEIPEAERSAMAWFELGTVDFIEGSHVEAREKLGRALMILQLAGDQMGAAAVWHQLGAIDLREGILEGARDRFEKSLAIKQSIVDRGGEALTLTQLGMIDRIEGSFDLARDKLGQALAIQKLIGHPASIAVICHEFAEIDRECGGYRLAREKGEIALGIWQMIGDRVGEAASLLQLGSLDSCEGFYGKARDNFERTLSISRAIGDRSGEADALAQLGSVDALEGSHVSAQCYLGQAMSIYEQVGDRGGEAQMWHQLGSIDLRNGLYNSALEKLRKAITIHQLTGDRYGEALAFFQLGHAAAEIGQPIAGALFIALRFVIDRAASHRELKSEIESLLYLCQQIGYEDREIRCLFAAARIEYERDRGEALMELFYNRPASPSPLPQEKSKHPWWKFWA